VKSWDKGFALVFIVTSNEFPSIVTCGSNSKVILRPKHKYEIQTIINHLNAYYHKLLI